MPPSSTLWGRNGPGWADAIVGDLLRCGLCNIVIVLSNQIYRTNYCYIYHGAYFYSFTRSAVSRIFFFFCTTLQLSKATIWFAQLGSHAKSNIHIQINRWNEGFLRLRDVHGHLHPLRIWAGTTHFFLGQLLYTAHICSPVLAKAFRSGRLVFITCDVVLFFARVGNFLAQASRQSWGEP